MVDWSNTWLMRFNAAKCHLLKITRQHKYHPTSYTIKGVQLQQVDHHPYLGVELTSDLTWKTHISNITSKANRILNLLRRHLYGCNQEVKSRAFTSLVRPHLEYSSSVWDPYFKQDISAIEKVQRKGARFVTGNYSHRDSVTSMLDTLHWPPLQDRRKVRRLTHLYKAVNNLSPVEIPDYVIPSSGRTRRHDLAYVQLRTNYEHYRNSFLPKTTREWNASPDLVHALSVDDFQARLQTYTAKTTHPHHVFNCK